MSTELVGRWPAHAQREQPAPPSTAEPPLPGAHDEALEFVRFCYARRRVAWPTLYDEMCAVAARGTYHGLGYGELAERGICFGLAELAHLSSLTDRVVREDAARRESGSLTHVVPMMLATARS